MNETLLKLGNIGLIPVCVIDDSDLAIPAAKALTEGGLGVIEITMRTEEGIPAIKKVKSSLPQMLVGAGTVLTMDKAKEATEAGAEFIVTPGFNKQIAKWCFDNSVVLIPGCVTPTEIDMALEYGIQVVKFFPANVYGGIEGLKELNGPYGNVRFVPTGGIDLKNMSDYLDKAYVHAVGGGFLCRKEDINAGNGARITETAKQAVSTLLGFELAHVGINTEDETKSKAVADMFDRAFGLGVKEGASSNFAGNAVEVMKRAYLGACGHIAIKTNNIHRALYYLEQRGYNADRSTDKEKNGKLAAVYLNGDFGGFAVHLLQK